MKNKRGNVAVIALIVVIVAIIAGVIGWMFAKKSQAPVQKEVATQSVESVQQIQPKTQSTTPVTQPTQQVSDETANWQTYANAKFGYQIKYPSGWLITEPQSESQLGIYNKDYKSSNGDNFFNITVTSTKKESLETWLAEKIKVDKKYLSETSVIGQRALKFNIPPSSQAPGNIEYYFIKDGMNFVLTTTYNSETNSIGEKILSTLKFTR